MRPIDSDKLKQTIYNDTAYGFYHECMDGSETVFTQNEVFDLIDNAPTLTLDDIVPHGRWIAQNEGRTRFMCSNCESKNYGGHEKYCPNCGAKMDLEV